MEDQNGVNLPPGFRFCPTDEELVVHFLRRKAAHLSCHPDIIPDLDLYSYDPWDLSGKAYLAEANQQWYYFSRKVQNRNTDSGFWMPLGTEEPIITRGNKKVGTKKFYVYYVGEAPSSGLKTSWVMQEYCLPDSASSSRSSKSGRHSKMDSNKWVLCRVYDRNCEDIANGGIELSCMDEVFLSLDDLEEISFPNN